MKRICYLLAFVMTLLVLLPVSSAFAATVGQQLTAPETGWQRYNDDHPAITYTGSWNVTSVAASYNGQIHATINGAPAGSYASFDFVGTKMRLIGQYWTTDSDSISVFIDGQQVSTISQLNGSINIRQILNYEITNLTNSRHSVKLVNNTTHYLVVDAIDIDDTGNLVNTSLDAPLNLIATSGNYVNLSWSSVTNATSYNVKRSTTANGPYNQIANITTTNFSDTSVTNATTYYYIITAVNSGGESAYSNEASGTSFGPVPNSPLITATAGNAKISITWNLVSDSTGYNVKRSTTPGGPYTTISSNVYGSSFVDTSVENGTTYYYIVTALNSAGESTKSNEASATPEAPSTPITGRALLVVQLTNGADKEFDLSMTEVNAFINWYEGKAAGTGTASFAIDKHDNNKGPFKSRKDYVIFDKIVSYEVNEYTPAAQ